MSNIKLFESKKIRSQWDADAEKPTVRYLRTVENAVPESKRFKPLQIVTV